MPTNASPVHSLAPLLAGLLFVLCAGCSGIHGLRPIEPSPCEFVDSPTVGSLTPTLRWERFPRPDDRRAIGVPQSASITNVTYEVRLTRVLDPRTDPQTVPKSDRELTATALSEPSWTTPQLAPGTQYNWTVRARFELDGRPRVTQWSQPDPSGFPPIYSPDDFDGFAFRTPG